MKIDFANLNIEPSPNPKTLAVEKIAVKITSEDGKVFAAGEGYIRNAKLDPLAHARG